MKKEEIVKLQESGIGERYCKSCDSNRPYKDFYIKKTKGVSNSYRFNSPCKECSSVKSSERILYERSYNLRVKYGITNEDYDNLLIKQNHCCAICGTKQEQLNTKLAVDHNHITGEVRGLLCTNCNLGIGNFMDSKVLLREAIKYLK